MCGQKRADDYLLKVFVSSISQYKKDIYEEADIPRLNDTVAVSSCFFIYPYDQIHLHHARSLKAPLQIPIPLAERFGTPFEQFVRF